MVTMLLPRSWMSPRTVQMSTPPGASTEARSPATGSSGSRISIASRKISPAMMRPLMKYTPEA